MKLHRVSCPSGRGMPRPNSAAPEQRRARTASRWRGVAAIRRCRSCRSNEASSRLMPVGARHAAPEQRRAPTAPRPNSVAPEQRRARTASRWLGVAAIRRCRSCRSDEASSRLMPVGARHAAPEQRRARTASRWRGVAAIRRGSDHDGIVIPQPGAPARLRVGIKSARECRKLCYRRHPPARSRSRRRGVPFGCMALI